MLSQWIVSRYCKTGGMLSGTDDARFVLSRPRSSEGLALVRRYGCDGINHASESSDWPAVKRLQQRRFPINPVGFGLLPVPPKDVFPQLMDMSHQMCSDRWSFSRHNSQPKAASAVLESFWWWQLWSSGRRLDCALIAKLFAEGSWPPSPTKNCARADGSAGRIAENSLQYDDALLWA